MEESGRQMREVEKWQTLRGRTIATNKIREKRKREKRDRESSKAEKKPSNWGTERPSAERSRGYFKLHMAEKRAACIQVSHFTPFMTVWMSSPWPPANPALTQKSSGQTDEPLMSGKIHKQTSDRKKRKGSRVLVSSVWCTRRSGGSEKKSWKT